MNAENSEFVREVRLTCEYKTIRATDPSVLDQEVTKALHEGYKLHGHPYVAINPSSLIMFFQAVVSPDVETGR